MKSYGAMKKTVILIVLTLAAVSYADTSKQICNMVKRTKKTLKAGNYVEALQECERILEIDSHSAEAKKIFNDIRGIFSTANMSPDPGVTQMFSGFKFYFEGKYDSALNRWQTALSAFDALPSITSKQRKEIGVLRKYFVKKVERKLRKMRKSRNVKLNKAYQIREYLGKGEDFLFDDELYLAKKEFEKVLKIEPGNTKAKNKRKEIIGKIKKAEKYYQAGLQLKNIEQFYFAKYYLGKAKEINPRHAKAVNEIYELER